MLSVLILIEDHGSDDAQTCVGSNQTELLDSLVSSLRNPGPPKRPNLDEAQITSLIQALLELSGGEVDLRQHVFAEDYTADENADLYASIFGITRTKQFGDFDPEELCNSISKSPVFSGMTINVRNLEIWTTRMRDFLPLGFPEGYLVRRPYGRIGSMLTGLESSIAGAEWIRRYPDRCIQLLSVRLHSTLIE